MRRLLVAMLVVVAACGGTDEQAASTTNTEAAAAVSVPEKRELPEIAPFGQGGAEFTAADGSVTCSCVLVADTREVRAQGLMNVTDLQGYAGMVFVFDEDSSSAFVMRDTPMPLSIGWFTEVGTLVSTADMDPCLDGGECVTYPAEGPYRFALEVPQGDLAAVGAVDGATFRLVDDCDA